MVFQCGIIKGRNCSYEKTAPKVPLDTAGNIQHRSRRSRLLHKGGKVNPIFQRLRAKLNINCDRTIIKMAYAHIMGSYPVSEDYINGKIEAYEKHGIVPIGVHAYAYEILSCKEGDS